MPHCPLHQGEDLEPKRKGWYCEECGAIVLGYDSLRDPDAEARTDDLEKRKLEAGLGRAAAHSLPLPTVDGTPTRPVANARPDLLPRADTTRWALTKPAACSARETLQSLVDSGAPSTVHTCRSGVDDVLPLCLGRPRRGLLVVGAPGVGKTTLLARLVDRLLGADSTSTDDAEAGGDELPDPRDVVIFLSGGSDYDIDAVKTGSARLCDAVTNCVDIRPGEFKSLEDLVAHLADTAGRDPKPQRKVWLVFDGIDEARSSAELIDAIDAFLPSLEAYPWVRLIVSMRRASYDVLAARGAAHSPSPAFAAERWWTWFRDAGAQREVPYLEVRRFDRRQEVRDAHEARRRAPGLAACNVDFDHLPPAIQDLLRCPLQLRLFHIAFRGDSAPSIGLDEPALMDAFLDSMVDDSPGLEKAMSRLGKALLRRRRANLPLELGDQWRSEWASQRTDPKARAPSPLDPIAELLSASGLMSPVEVGHGSERGQVAWRFCHERIGEQVLLRELLASISPRTSPTCEELLSWALIAAGTPQDGPYNTLLGALELLVGRLASRGESSFAKCLLEINDKTIRCRLIGAVLRTIAEGWDDDDEVPSAAATLDALMTAAMSRERGKRLVAVVWRPLFDLAGDGPRPAVCVLHRRLAEVARYLYHSRGTAEVRVAYASTLQLLGDAAHIHGDHDDARRYLEEAIRQLSDLAGRAGADDSVRSALAQVHRKLAAVESEPARVRKNLEAALRVASATDDESQALPPGQHHELLLALLAMGDALCDAAPREAEQAYEEAHRASVAALAGAPHRADLRRCRAAALAGLGEIAMATGRLEAASTKFGMSIRVLRKLSRREPHRWDCQLELVDILRRHGEQLRRTASDQDACQLYEEAAAIMLALVHGYPHRTQWRSELVRILANLGVLMRQIGEDEPARACLEDAVHHGRALEPDPAGRRAMVSALVSLTQLDEVEGRRFEARKHVDEGLGLLRAMSTDPAARAERRSLALMLSTLSQIAADEGDGESAQEHAHEAVRVLSALVTETPHDLAFQADLGEAINGLRCVGGGGRLRRIPKHIFSIMVKELGGIEIREFFDRDRITLGRAPGNDLMLPNYSVSRHHATVTFQDGVFTIEDLGSKHGIAVNGKRVNGHVAFHAGGHVELGDFVLVFEGPVDTSYGAQWSSMMANAPTGYPPPEEETNLQLRSELLSSVTLDDTDELQLDPHDLVDIDES